MRASEERRDDKARVVRLSDETGLDMLLLPLRSRGSSVGNAVLIAYIHGENRSRTERVEQLMHLFSLTRSEATLALNLSRGLSIGEAAKAQDKTIETARSYSKQAYAKIGARGQSDLVRILVSSAVAMA